MFNLGKNWWVCYLLALLKKQGKVYEVVLTILSKEHTWKKKENLR